MRVLCYGDSNTYGYDPRSYLGGRYPARDRWVDILAEKTGWELINAGENGREIPRRGPEIQRAARQIKERAADRLLVMLGTNDLLQGADADTAAARMEAFLTGLDMERGRILLIAPPPLQLGMWVPEEGLIAASVQLAGRYRELARRLGTGFADAGEWGVALTFDGVHFTEEGNRAFAQGLLTELRAIG